MSALECPPSLDPVAAARWSSCSTGVNSPWLHEEVASRMQERLEFIKLKPSVWVHWEPLRGGLQTHRILQKRYPNAQVWLACEQEADHRTARMALQAPWWQANHWFEPRLRTGLPAQAQAHMLWANMCLHTSAAPQRLLQIWHKTLAVNGFLMFSCLGPDTLRELRDAYARNGWPEPAHEFTDMHDWGDMLVEAGFAEPVMDMERITLTYETPAQLLADLRAWGRNLHVRRFAGLRGRRWRQQLDQLLSSLSRPEADGRLTLSFEIVYGHALKPPPRVPMIGQTEIGLDQMRLMLKSSSVITDKV